MISGDAGTTDPEVIACLRRLRESKLAAFAGKVRADVAAGRLPEDTDAHALARHTKSVLTGLARAELEAVARIAERARG